MLDLRTQLRSRLGARAADAAFAATLRPIVARALSAAVDRRAPGDIGLVDRSAEDAWLRERFHPGALSRFKEFAASIAGKPGADLLADPRRGSRLRRGGGIEPGHAAGDVVVPKSTAASTRWSCGGDRERD